MRIAAFIPSLALVLACCAPLFAQTAEPWQAAYTGDDATGKPIIALWNFDDGGAETVPDASGKGHDGTLAGAARHAEGRFGGGMASLPGWPVDDTRHAVVVRDAPELSPSGAFTLEMWVCPDKLPEGYGESFLMDKKYVAHADYQWILDAPDKQGGQRVRAVLGFGESSETWYSAEPAVLKEGVWSHLALTYDGAGTVTFFQDGRSLGGATKPRGPVFPGAHDLSLGDRVGSYYHGFPGRMDEIRIITGAREFRPVTVTVEHTRTVYRRMEPSPLLRFRLTNHRRTPVTGLTATVTFPGGPAQTFPVAEIAPGAAHTIECALDTRLRPDTYAVSVGFAFADGEQTHGGTETFPVELVGRRPPRMPVVMWGIGGTEGVLENLDTLRDLGFTHCLGLRCDFGGIWDTGAPAPAVDEAALAESRRVLDRALANDLGIVISVSPGAWLEEKADLLRTAAPGQTYDRPNLCCNAPGVRDFARNVGASIAQTYGEFPAFEAALIHTEVRDGTQICFHEHDRELCRAATGADYPENIGGKNGVSWTKLPGFPENRVVPDDDPLLRFYQWFWREGDGWNGLHSAVNEGLKSTDRKDLWSFFDPAVRVPALWGSGGGVDFLSHWTYSYPDPLRMGLAADELFAMAKGGPEGQNVMKMTQIIWYRSQTAPQEDAPEAAAPRSPWEDHDPGANYITIAPAHLREAFWTKIARPVRGIMYHGWQSLVPTEGPSVYRYTHPETRNALRELTRTVVEPLGPTLLQVPAVRSDVAFLESFSSAMFAGRGTYGWGGSWGGDAYHVLLYAHLQPEIVYEETILKHGLDGYKVLVLADCDVLPASVVEKVNAFQAAGGLLVGDDRLCPAVKPDILLEPYTRTKKADEDKKALLDRAVRLYFDLSPHYRAPLASSNADALPYLRRYGTADYVFAVNDHREFGNYVGRHGLVMEQGLPVVSVLTLSREKGRVYDLVEHREVAAETGNGSLSIPVELEPGGGRIFLVTDTPVEAVAVQAPGMAVCGQEMEARVVVTDREGNPVDAVIPLELRILDPDGRRTEFSGFHAAPGGVLDLRLAFAANDVPGVWTIEARELAAGTLTRHFVRVQPGA